MGTWLVANCKDVTIDKEIVVAGEFRDKDDAANAIYRKFAPYAQDKTIKLLQDITLTVPKMTV